MRTIRKDKTQNTLEDHSEKHKKEIITIAMKLGKLLIKECQGLNTTDALIKGISICTVLFSGLIESIAPNLSLKQKLDITELFYKNSKILVTESHKISKDKK